MNDSEKAEQFLALIKEKVLSDDAKTKEDINTIIDECSKCDEQQPEWGAVGQAAECPVHQFPRRESSRREEWTPGNGHRQRYRKDAVICGI